MAKKAQGVAPEQQVELTKVAWILVSFSNGDSFKVSAKMIARNYVDNNLAKGQDPKELFEVAIRNPQTLITWASSMTWHQIAPHAMKNEKVSADYIGEWAQAKKGHTLEEPVREPRLFPQEPFKTVNEVEKEAGKKKPGGEADEDEDEESFEDA